MIRTDNNKGYTLLEVMVALLIVTMSLGAVFQNLSQSKRSSLRSERAVKAVRLANNIFHDVDMINRVVRGETIEDNIPGEENWQYRFFAEPLVLDGMSFDGRPLAIDSIKKLNLFIRYDAGNQKQSYHFIRWCNP